MNILNKIIRLNVPDRTVKTVSLSIFNNATDCYILNLDPSEIDEGWLTYFVEQENWGVFTENTWHNVSQGFIAHELFKAIPTLNQTVADILQEKGITILDDRN